jgi:hypothetical protein
MQNVTPITPTTHRRPTIEDTTSVECDSCKGIVFQSGIFLRKLSPLLTEDGKPGYIPIPNVTFYCVKCGHVNDEFIPEQLKPKSNIITIS